MNNTAYKKNDGYGIHTFEIKIIHLTRKEYKVLKNGMKIKSNLNLEKNCYFISETVLDWSDFNLPESTVLQHLCLTIRQ